MHFRYRLFSRFDDGIQLDDGLPPRISFRERVGGGSPSFLFFQHVA